MPSVDKSPCSVGQQLARSEDEMYSPQIPGIDGIGSNILKGILYLVSYTYQLTWLNYQDI